MEEASAYIEGTAITLLMNKITLSATIVILAGIGISTAGFTVLNAAIAQTATDNATMGGNMTMRAGNMTEGNMTDATGQISGGVRGCGDTCFLEGSL